MSPKCGLLDPTNTNMISPHHGIPFSHKRVGELGSIVLRETNQAEWLVDCIIPFV